MASVAGVFSRAFSVPLAALERWLLAGPPGLEATPLFVISLPRSGSTLLYLLLAQRFRVVYFSNLMAAFPMSPVAVHWITRGLNALEPPSGLESHYGATQGWRAPNQGWRMWNRWFPESLDFIDPDHLDPTSVGEMRATVAALQRAENAPFINKWQRHVPRLRALAVAFPEALFINLTRSPVLVAQSILAGRREFLGDERAWLSARPRDHARIEGRDPVEQVCLQVFLLDQDLQQDIAAIGADRFLNVGYESLCTSPAETLTRVADWYLARSGRSLAIRRPLAVTLEARSRAKIPAAEVERIRRTLNGLYATGGR
jgi:hypothetical protein